MEEESVDVVEYTASTLVGVVAKPSINSANFNSYYKVLLFVAAPPDDDGGGCLIVFLLRQGFCWSY